MPDCPVAFVALGDVFWGPGRGDSTAGVAAFGAEIDDPIRVFDDFVIVLDDEHHFAGLDQRVQHLEKLANIINMQPGCQFIEDAEGESGSPLRQFLGQFDAVRLAAREGVASWLM